MTSVDNHVKFARFVFLADVYIFIRFEIFIRLEILFYYRDHFFLPSIYYKIIVSSGFCGIHNSRGYQHSASADNPYLDLDFSGYLKNLIK